MESNENRFKIASIFKFGRNILVRRRNERAATFSLQSSFDIVFVFVVCKEYYCFWINYQVSFSTSIVIKTAELYCDSAHLSFSVIISFCVTTFRLGFISIYFKTFLTPVQFHSVLTQEVCTDTPWCITWTPWLLSYD